MRDRDVLQLQAAMARLEPKSIEWSTAGARGVVSQRRNLGVKIDCIGPAPMAEQRPDRLPVLCIDALTNLRRNPIILAPASRARTAVG
jgi:hypothetical protein